MANEENSKNVSDVEFLAAAVATAVVVVDDDDDVVVVASSSSFVVAVVAAAAVAVVPAAAVAPTLDNTDSHIHPLHPPRGNFHLIMHGEKGSTTALLLNPEEAYFESGRAYDFVTTTRGVGHVHSADLIWEYSYHPLNPITWRVFSESRMFVNRVEVEKFGGGKRHVFCAQVRN